MRIILIAAATAALLAAPSSAQRRPAGDAIRGAAGAVEEAAPVIDRTTDAMLDLDIGPLLDAADPYGRRGRHRTLREIARRDDPRFERRMRASIYGTASRLAGMMDAIAAAEPAMRRSLRDMERAVETVVEAGPRRLPPGEVDDDWDRDLEEGRDEEPY